MYDDPVVEEVRKVRREIMAECDNDPAKFLKRMRKIQERFKDRLVCRKPQPALRSGVR